MEKLRLKLKDLYLKMLKNDDDEEYNLLIKFIIIFENSSTDHGFIWIIKAMRRIHDEASTEMFPNYLDKESIQFLFDVFKVI
jgi:hypothetical protein